MARSRKHSLLTDTHQDLLTGGLDRKDFTGSNKSDMLTGTKGADTLSGLKGNDTLSGGGGKDQLDGGAGKDSLSGGSGDDSLIGGAGADTLAGGKGKDVFGFANAKTSAADSAGAFSAKTGDVIDDFATSDRIDFTDLAKASSTGALTFSGSTASKNGVWFTSDGTDTIVLADTTDDGTADLAIMLEGFTGTLTASDFIGVAASPPNGAPTITSGSTASIAENPAAGTTVYAAAASDPESGALTWTLSGADAAAFDISPNDGKVTFKAAPDFENPQDIGKDNVYNIIVTAKDAGQLAASKDITITVTNVNEAPVITSAATASIAENSPTNTAVYTATRSDPDANDTVTWSLTGADKNAFTIAADGKVTFKASPDFEAKSSYAITVNATDGGKLVASKDVTVSVTNVNEAPVITSAATASIAENSPTNTAVYTATRNDPDANDTVTWSLTGADKNAFTIAGDGKVTFKASPDFEAKSSYAITVNATDSGNLVASKDVTITINNVDEPISAIADSNAAANQVDENAAVGTVVGITALATDPDGAVTYSLDDNANGLFSIDAQGVVKLAGAINFETTGGTKSITVRATNGQSSTTQNFDITINNVDESISAIADNDATVNQVDENAAVGTVVGITALATDPEDAVTYSLDDDAGGLFSIDAQGVVKVADAIDFETTGATKTIIVRATAGQSSTTQNFDITINNVDEPISAIADNDATVNQVDENAAVGTVVGITALATDPDGAVTYSLDDDAGGLFSIDAQGVVTVASAIDFRTTGATKTITVRATAGQSTTTQDFDITINNVAPADPTLTLQSGGTQAGGIRLTSGSVISTDTPVLSGNGVDPNNAFIVRIVGPQGDQVYGGQGLFTGATVAQDGSWSIDLSQQGQNALTADGDYRIFLIQNDGQFNNPGAATAVATFTHKNATGGDDQLMGGAFADHLVGLDGDDSLFGNGGDDKLEGGNGNDGFDGGDGNDTLLGGDGNDWLVASRGNDVIDGGNGGDWAVFDQAPGNGATGVTVDLGRTDAQDVGGGFDMVTLSGIENVKGSTKDDRLTASGTGNGLSGFDGNDTLLGGLGDDNIDGGAGDDSIDGGGGDNWFVASTGHDTIIGGTGWDWLSFQDAAGGANNLGVTVDLTQVGPQAMGGGFDAAADSIALVNINGVWGSAFNDTLTGDDRDNDLRGDAGNDTLSGGGGDDNLDGGAGNDSIDGGNGDDWIAASTGNDTLNGGAGWDVVDFSNAPMDPNGVGVTVDLVMTNAQTVGGGYDDITFVGIEELVGTVSDDKFTGNDSGVTLSGNSGFDTLVGGAGDDELYGGGEDDRLDGGAGDDLLDGGFGDDSIVGGIGFDIFVVSAGNDTIDGSADWDQVDFSNATGSANNVGITVSLADTAIQVLGGGFDTLQLSGIEAVTGSTHNDKLTGDDFDNNLYGIDGNDTLIGAGGNDFFDGGFGDDSIDGGIGNDYVFASLGNDTVNGGDDWDQIDFGGAPGDQNGLGVTVDLTRTDDQSVGGGFGTMKISGIEVVAGSGFADTLTGDDNDNMLDGRGGADTMSGGLGDDGYSVDDGNDVIHETAGEGYDWVVASVSYALAAGEEIEDLELLRSAGNINATGNEFGNRLISNDGDNILNGGDDFDIASWKTAVQGVTVTLVNADQGQNTGDGFDTLLNIEGLEGSRFNDTLTGDANNNRLIGRDGADTLTGGAGFDNFDFRFNGAFIDAADTITDYRNDLFDFLNLSSFLGVWGSGYDLDGLMTDGYVSISTTGGVDTVIRVDLDASGGNFAAEAVFILKDFTGTLGNSDFFLG